MLQLFDILVNRQRNVLLLKYRLGRYNRSNRMSRHRDHAFHDEIDHRVILRNHNCMHLFIFVRFGYFEKSCVFQDHFYIWIQCYSNIKLFRTYFDRYQLCDIEFDAFLDYQYWISLFLDPVEIRADSPNAHLSHVHWLQPKPVWIEFYQWISIIFIFLLSSLCSLIECKMNTSRMLTLFLSIFLNYCE